MTSDLHKLREELTELDKLITMCSEELAILLEGLKEPAGLILSTAISEGELREQEEILQAVAIASHRLKGLEQKRVIKQALLDKLTAAANQPLGRSA